MNPLEDDEDRWPDEPDEFDPDSLGPDVPDVEPEVGTPFEAAADVDEEVFRAFWGAVVFLNVAVAGFAVGAMLVYFRGDWSTGGPSILIGCVAAAFVVRFYRSYLATRDDGADRGADDRDPEVARGGGGAGSDGTRNDGAGDPGAGTDGAGDPGAGTDGAGDPGAGTDGAGDPGAGTDGAGDPGAGTDGAGDPGAGTDGAGDPGAGDGPGDDR